MVMISIILLIAGTIILISSALGAIEFIEGEKREPKRKKRDLSVYDNKEPEPKENVIGRILNRLKKN